MPDYSAEELINTVVGERYLVLSLLGEGAMGNVFLAEDQSLRRKVAIKVLRDEWGMRTDVVKRLENECRLMAHLGQHSNIVMLLDRLVVDGRTMLVMEYADGETLAKILGRTAKREGAVGSEETSNERSDALPMVLTPDLCVEIASQCLRALDYAHSRGVLHLDIKPSNIMIQRDNLGHITAKLMDFGISKTRADANFASAVTALTFTDGAGMGTPAYMAPEQIDPERFGSPGPASDVYSFGITLFEMVTRQLPFVGGYTEVLHAHASTRPPNPRDINPEIPSQVARVILTALRKSPGNRYHTAGEMLKELQGLRSDGGLNTPLPEEHEQEAIESSGWRPKLRLLTRVAVLSAVLLFVFAFWQLEWEIPGRDSGFMRGGGLTVRDARESALSARQETDTPEVHAFASTEWEKAEVRLAEADSMPSAAESVVAYLEAQDLFEQARQAAQERMLQREIASAEDAETTEEEVQPPSQMEAEVEPPADATALHAQGRSRRDGGQTTVIPLGEGVNLEMAWIPPGTFAMGGQELTPRAPSRRQRDAGAQATEREVWLPQGFWMGRFEVTQAQWNRIMGHNPSKFRGNPTLPVDSVSWNDCQEFITRLNQVVPGGGFRLPTEAEWEYAARAGIRTTYYGGNLPDRLGEFAWYSGNSGGMTRPVGQKLPNAWGLHDMLGNLWEWVEDWHSPDYHLQRPYTNPTGPAGGHFKVLRGGAWSYFQEHLRLTSRTSNVPSQRQDVYGFRVVRHAAADTP